MLVIKCHCSYLGPGLLSVQGSASLREPWAKIYWLLGLCCVCGFGVYREGWGRLRSLFPGCTAVASWSLGKE